LVFAGSSQQLDIWLQLGSAITASAIDPSTETPATKQTLPGRHPASGRLMIDSTRLFSLQLISKETLSNNIIVLNLESGTCTIPSNGLLVPEFDLKLTSLKTAKSLLWIDDL
jgi:hypothetical protein